MRPLLHALLSVWRYNWTSETLTVVFSIPSLHTLFPGFLAHFFHFFNGTMMNFAMVKLKYNFLAKILLITPSQKLRRLKDKRSAGSVYSKFGHCQRSREKNIGEKRCIKTFNTTACFLAQQYIPCIIISAPSDILSLKTANVEEVNIHWKYFQ